MDRSPKISVVIPAYHAEKTIGNTLNSILSQTLPPWEIIVIDDGSRDGTVRLVQTQFPQVQIVSQPNAGPAAARNHGISLAKGDWIALLDADDTWKPQKLERQAVEIADDVGIIHAHTVGDLGKNLHQLDFDELWNHNYIGTSTVLMNKAVFKEAGGFPEDRTLIGAEDYNLWLRMAATGKRIVTIREELTHYTPAEGNLSGQISRVVKAELLNLELIGKQFQLDQSRIEEKRIAILDEYSRAFFWMRDLSNARRYYGELLKLRFRVKTLGFWLATFLPLRMLDATRKPQQSKNEKLLQAATAGASQ